MQCTCSIEPQKNISGAFPVAFMVTTGQPTLIEEKEGEGRIHEPPSSTPPRKNVEMKCFRGVHVARAHKPHKVAGKFFQLKFENLEKQCLPEQNAGAWVKLLRPNTRI